MTLARTGPGAGKPNARAATKTATAVSGDALPSPCRAHRKVAVEEGQQVTEGDLVVVLEAMKMEQPSTHTRSGTVIGLKAEVGTSISSAPSSGNQGLSPHPGGRTKTPVELVPHSRPAFVHQCREGHQVTWPRPRAPGPLSVSADHLLLRLERSAAPATPAVKTPPSRRRRGAVMNGYGPRAARPYRTP